MATKESISGKEIELLERRLTETTSQLLTIRQLGIDLIESDSTRGVSIEALSEKAGVLIDECLEAIGASQVIGGAAEWREADHG